MTLDRTHLRRRTREARRERIRDHQARVLAWSAFVADTLRDNEPLPVEYAAARLDRWRTRLVAFLRRVLGRDG